MNFSKLRGKQYLFGKIIWEMIIKCFINKILVKESLLLGNQESHKPC